MLTLLGLLCLAIGLIVGIIDDKFVMPTLEWFVLGIGLILAGGALAWPPTWGARRQP